MKSDGERFRVLRMQHRVTQEAVAKAAGTSRNSVARFEADDPQLKPATVMVIKRALEDLIASSTSDTERADIREVTDALDAAMKSDEPLDPAYYHAASMLRRAPEEDWPFMLRDLVRIWMSLTESEKPRDSDKKN